MLNFAKAILSEPKNVIVGVGLVCVVGLTFAGAKNLSSRAQNTVERERPNAKRDEARMMDDIEREWYELFNRIQQQRKHVTDKKKKKTKPANRGRKSKKVTLVPVVEMTEDEAPPVADPVVEESPGQENAPQVTTVATTETVMEEEAPAMGPVATTGRVVVAEEKVPVVVVEEEVPVVVVEEEASVMAPVDATEKKV